MLPVLSRRFDPVVARYWAIALGLYTALGGLISFSGWAMNQPRLTDWFHLGLSIQPNAALAAAACGAGILCLALRWRWLALMSGVIASLVGGLTLFEQVTDVGLGIDAIFLFGRTWGDRAVVAHGRMGAPASLSFLMTGVALVIVALGARRFRARGLAGSLVTATIAISWLSLIGYLFGATALYSIPRATAIALQTSTFVLAGALGVTLSMPGYGPARLLQEDSVSGELLRRTLPAIVFVPVFLGYFWVAGERLGYFDFAFGAAAATLAEIVLLLSLLWWTTSDVSAAENERRRTEAKLLANQAMLQTVTEEAEVGLVIVGPSHRYLYANRAYCEIVRADPDTIIGRQVVDVLPDVYEWRIRDKVDRAFAGETVRYELELDERQQFVSITYQPLWRNGIVESVIVAIVDTTDRRRVEEHLKESQAQLQDAAERKDQFLMTLAHELRNPLAAMRTANDLIRIAPDRDQVVRSRDVIDRQLTLMARLLDDLIDVRRLSRDEITLQPEDVDLALVLRDGIDAVRPVAARLRQHLDVTLPDRPMFIRADPARLEQIIANLLNNACRFSRPDGRIRVTLSRHGDVARLVVSDQGIGIETRNLVKIFEPFSQVDRSVQRDGGGLGVGLHQVKRLVGLHQGTVEARSAGLGRGSEFIVELPALVEAVAPAPRAKAVPPATVPPKRILVIDDNTDAANGMKLLLGFSGHDAHVAHDGPSAIEAFTRLHPDVVLLDIGLPGMSGLEVCRRLRELPADPPPLIIALTGWGTDADREKSRAAGFDHHLVKPVEYSVLTALLAAAPS
jgi:PAS domain S-box-containing protein